MGIVLQLVLLYCLLSQATSSTSHNFNYSDMLYGEIVTTILLKLKKAFDLGNT